MDILAPLISERAYFNPPGGILGWLLWLFWWLLLFVLVRRWSRFNAPLTRDRRWLFVGLFAAGVVTSLFLGIRLPALGALPLPDVPLEPRGPVFFVLSAVPWFLAAGFLGPAYSAIIALASGFLIGLFDHHNPYYFQELALLGLVLGFLLRQRYRTLFFRLARHPIFAALLLSLGYAGLFTLNAAFLSTGSIVARLDFAISNLPSMWLSVTGCLLVGGLAGEVFVATRIRQWGGVGPLEPSPAEQSLQARFFYTMIPIGLIVVIALIIGDWVVSGQAARQLLQDRMSSAVGTSVDGIPFFLEAGQDLIQQIGDDPRLYNLPAEQTTDVLRENLRRVPFFRQLYYLNAEEELIAGFPEVEYVLEQAPLDEQVGVDLALKGVKIQSYAVPPQDGKRAAQVTFISNVQDEAGVIQGILIGRIDLESNPFTQQMINSLESLGDLEGQGYLLDEQGRILYHPNPDLLMTEYTAAADPENPLSDQTAANGTRSLVYYQEAIGRPWAAAMWVPARQGQQLSLEFAAPLLLMILLLALGTVITANFGIRGVTTSLRQLTVEADRIAQGRLDHPLAVDGVDEVGQLRRSFEFMRRSLKARLDELNQLLKVSQGVASSLDLDETLYPVLDAAVANGANSARIALDPRAVPESDQSQLGVSTVFVRGLSSGRYSDLDDQVLVLAREQEQIILTNPARVRVLRFESESNRPQAMAAFALRHENQYYGVFWVAYDAPHIFGEEEIRYLTTLASQAALAAGNSYLFLSAELGRQRLAAILESTPDAVLVTDARDRLLLVNPAARKILSHPETNLAAGTHIAAAVTNPELAQLLHRNAPDRQSAEIVLPDGRTYLAIASNTMMNGQRGGRVCVLRDITQFKELDALKSEFVNTVSHDLRSPLTLIRGYATMLQMVGELNDQQSNYVRKIVTGIENMSRLVSNLLDLGRIEAGVGLQLELTPVRDVVEQAISTLQHQSAQKQIDLAVKFPDGSEPIVEADPALLLQAVQNLVENAIKYTEVGGRVDVIFETRQENAVLIVADTGIGIAPVDQARLFEKFYRVARRGTMQQKGTGLGLAIVKSIAERHGGRVWVESQLGKGSRFFFLIPLRQPKPQDKQNSKELPIKNS